MPGAGEPPSGRPLGRLTRRAEFLRTASGRRFHTSRVTVQGRIRDGDVSFQGEPGLRVGYTLTKRVGHSTERNRIRRRLKAAMADLARTSRLPDMHAFPLDIVLIGRRDCLSASYPTLLSDLERAIPAVAAPGAPRPVPSRPTSPRDPSSPRTRGARRRTTPDA